MGQRAIFQGVVENCLNLVSLFMKKHISVHKKISMRQNFEINCEKKGFIICFKKIKRKHGVTELVFFLQVKIKKFSISPVLKESSPLVARLKKMILKPKQ